MPLNDLMAAVSTQVLAVADRDTALRAAAGMLACREAAEDALFHSLRERENVGSTAIGHGIAIPHGRLPALEAPRGALLLPAVKFCWRQSARRVLGMTDTKIT